MSDKCTNPELGALLHAYELGALDDDDTERFEMHTMECRFCYNELVEFTAYTESLRRSRLPRELARGEEAPQTRGWRDYLWPESPLLLRPVLLLVVIVALIYPAYLGLTFDADTPETTGPVQMIHFSPTRSGASNTLTLSQGNEAIIDYSFGGAVAGHRYQVAVRGDNGEEVLTYSGVCSRDGIERGCVKLSLKDMTLGIYTLKVTDPDNPEAPTQEYPFRVVE